MPDTLESKRNNHLLGGFKLGLSKMLGLPSAPGETRIAGRSRYSKALPSVPVGHDNSLPLPPVPRHLPKLHLPAFPDPPSPSAQRQANDDGNGTKGLARKPVGSSAPNQSPPRPEPTSLDSPPPSSTASMTIPRRPIASSALQLPPQPTLIVPPEPSPTDSISSLLSAYSREPDDPMSGSTYTTASTSNNSGPDSENPTDLDSPTARKVAPPTPSATAKSGTGWLGPNEGSRPAPPPKDEQRDKPYSQPKPLPFAPAPEQTSITSTTSTSPPRPEIWKRRPQTAEKNKELPDLKLNFSHGSTASVSSTQTAVIRGTSDAATESKSAEDTRQASPPRPPVVGLPGRNIRPAAKDKPQEESASMGSAASKVSNLKDKLQLASKSSEARKFPPRTDSARPPTPEYRRGDINPSPSLADNVAKPASPISSSGSPKEGVKAAEASSSLPQRTGGKPAAWFSTPFSPSPGPRLPAAAPDLRLATSLQDLPRRGPSPPIEDVSPATRRPVFPPNEPSRGPSISPDSASKRITPPGSSGLGIVATTSSRRPGTSSGSSDPRIVYSDTQGPMYRGRDGTLYAEMKVTSTPDPRAAYFPTQTDKPIGAGTIISAKPLSQSHYDCFQKHRTMNRRSNRNYPLTCQTCDRADAEDRWVCTFCHLRICETCNRALIGHQKVLRSLVDQLGMSTPLSMSSASRPGSALGIEVSFD